MYGEDRGHLGWPTDEWPLSRSPIGIVAGAINKPNQTAAEIVTEIVEQAAELLGGAKGLVVTGSKL